MKYLSLILSIVFFSNSVFATCDYSKIVSNADGTYTYSKELHLCVGQMKQDLDVSQQQVAKLTEALSLKELALEKADDRTNLWREISYKMEDRVDAAQNMQSTNKTLYFGLGVLASIAAIYGASKVVRH